MKTYYIYHIPGVKIGCTNNIKNRFRRYDVDIKYEILETHSDIYIASEREIELQKQYGYKVDTVRYWKVVATWGGDIETKKRNGKLASSRYSKENGMNALKSGQWESVKHLGAEVQKKPILVFDAKTNEFISEYSSLSEASNKLNVLSSGICNVAKGNNKTYKGYIFKYKQ